MKIIGGLLVIIGIAVGVYAYNQVVTISSEDVYKKDIADLDYMEGRSREKGLTDDELVQKRISEKNQTYIIAGVLFIGGIILFSRNNSKNTSESLKTVVSQE